MFAQTAEKKVFNYLLFIIDPTWISINTGAVICINCSGIHRKLGVHISKVRSLDLDFVPPEVQLVFIYLSLIHLIFQAILKVGNNGVNSIYEANLKPEEKISPNANLYFGLYYFL